MHGPHGRGPQQTSPAGAAEEPHPELWDLWRSEPGIHGITLAVPRVVRVVAEVIPAIAKGGSGVSKRSVILVSSKIRIISEALTAASGVGIISQVETIVTEISAIITKIGSIIGKIVTIIVHICSVISEVSTLASERLHVVTSERRAVVLAVAEIGPVVAELRTSVGTTVGTCIPALALIAAPQVVLLEETAVLPIAAEGRWALVEDRWAFAERRRAFAERQRAFAERRSPFIEGCRALDEGRIVVGHYARVKPVRRGKIFGIESSRVAVSGVCPIKGLSVSGVIPLADPGVDMVEDVQPLVVVPLGVLLCVVPLLPSRDALLPVAARVLATSVLRTVTGEARVVSVGVASASVVSPQVVHVSRVVLSSGILDAACRL